MARPGARILDTDHLARQSAGDDDLERELLRLFEAQCARLVPLITGSGPVTDRTDAIHTLRGGALAVGATQLADLSALLETAVLDHPEDAALRPLLDGLRDAASELEREIQRWRSRAAQCTEFARTAAVDPGLAKRDGLA